MDGRDQQKGQESQKTQKKTTFLLRVGGSGKVKGPATTPTVTSCSTLVMRMYAGLQNPVSSLQSCT